MQSLIFTIALLLAASCMAVSPHPCPKNSEFKECGTPCRATCTYKPGICVKRCEIGCFCVKGYILKNNSTFTCIKEEDCCQYILVE
ncbi:cysteine-rich venom protein 6 [Cephus cinctus]|uniref:Cysteine-rich venom protein 6 n=1 Tax=Cephus cinctus TaxID=211228 RepID=A0AAJ7FKD4_CEPCN|nr:cysteine-rich venom protein 6 [Cephus cinctus]